MAKERLSACIVLYHSGEATMETLACLEAANERVDVYVVDNSPEDDLAEQIRWRHPGVKIRKQKKNIGFGRANNVVLDELQSDYHLIINPDVTFDADLLTRMIDYMDKHPNAVALTPRVFNADDTEQMLPKCAPTVRYLLSGRLERFGGMFTRWRKEYTMTVNGTPRVPIRVYFATGCFLLIRTDVFKKLGGFDPRFFLYHEDSDLSRRMSELGPIIYHPEMTIKHAWRRESAKSTKAMAMHLWSTIKYFAKWGLKW